jgi:hypothetical protein
MKERLYIQIVQRERERSNDNMWRPLGTSEGLRVPAMNDGEIIDEMIRLIETDGQILTDEQVIDKIARLLKRENKL